MQYKESLFLFSVSFQGGPRLWPLHLLLQTLQPLPLLDTSQRGATYVFCVCLRILYLPSCYSLSHSCSLFSVAVPPPGSHLFLRKALTLLLCGPLHSECGSPVSPEASQEQARHVHRAYYRAWHGSVMWAVSLEQREVFPV